MIAARGRNAAIMRELRRREMGIAQQRGRAEPSARKPGQHGFRAILAMNENTISSHDAVRREPAGNARHRFGELGVRPGSHRAVERGPDQCRMRATLACARLDERGDILSGEGMNRTDIGHHDVIAHRG